jgi:hypothetical protein
MNQKVTIDMKLISLCIGALLGVITIGTATVAGAVWGLEKHFDDRYLLIAESFEGKLLDRKRDLIIEQSKPKPNQSLIDLYKIQIEELKQKLGKG